MKIVPRVSAVIILCLLSVLFLLPPTVSHAAEEDEPRKLTSWEMVWPQNPADNTVDKLVSGRYEWTTIQAGSSIEQQLTSSPHTAWIRIKLPEDVKDNMAIFFERIYGQQIRVYKDGQILYEQGTQHQFNRNPLLIPLHDQDAGGTIVIWTHSDYFKVGVDPAIWIGSSANLNKKYVSDGIDELVLGSILLVLSVVIIAFSMFMYKLKYKLWLGISILIGCLGFTISMNSSTIYTFYPDMTQLFYYSFLICFAIELPVLAYCFEQIFTSDEANAIIRKLRNYLMAYTLFYIFCTVASLLYPEMFLFMKFITGPVFGVIYVLELLVLLYVTIKEAIRGEQGATLLSVGFGLFALTTITEWILYYSVPWYELDISKWTIFIFVCSILTVKGQRLLGKYEEVVRYTEELEAVSNELQRSEKIKIISELAASVAHEVRNPLQVTRGFLQLMSKQDDDKNKKYVGIALEELDRASDIINDFLTFAKPEFDHIALINLSEEFNHIEGVLIPMANLEGGIIIMDIPNNLWIRGNSSKFKQAFINIMKNSIEALQGSGEVKVKAYLKETEVVIHVQDNGIGMNQEELVRLGEPYFSNKTKGTGLGMMVTFRIIEAMEGTIEYSSEKEVGTEAVIRFPSGV
ncbi:hypothetical protein J45TS6_24780 [Paenibacillus sp. J45TS6]|uniref:sensor histidine kinase n=1 Tax=Paenibacillus sp. J45TS6 TaxID=2807196 RepID=UPI001B1EDEE8|nr:HAMP domain-containing sensor histidine kinase [Paenibacillus sp. J45TS6]GIP44019.1 hypothetical protein J45TS6_24780 [Paenibacillus sp. J45TS6]